MGTDLVVHLAMDNAHAGARDTFEREPMIAGRECEIGFRGEVVNHRGRYTIYMRHSSTVDLIL